MNDSAAVRQHQFAGGDVQRTLLVLAAWFVLAVWLGTTGKLVTTRSASAPQSCCRCSCTP